MNIKIITAIPSNAIDLSKINSLTYLNTYKSEEYWINEEIIKKYSMSEDQKRLFLEKKSKEIQDNPWSYILAKNGDKIVWYACWKKHIDKEYNELFAIYILPEYHKKWIWKLLIKEVFNYLWFDKDIIVQVIWYNENAIWFYKKVGFEKDIDLKDYEMLKWIWVPEVQMIKKVV
jgi:GNAT superfamily N-acetyltransferase